MKRLLAAIFLCLGLATPAEAVTAKNVHIGLSAWAGTTGYVVGDRRSNGGNAYKQTAATCTSAGAGGPSGTGTGITDGSCVWDYLSAIDYSSLSSLNTYVASLTATFTDTIEIRFWNDGVITGTGTWSGPGVMTQPIQVPSGLGTTASNRLVFKCASGESAFDNGNRPLWLDTSAGVTFQNTATGSFSIFAYVYGTDYVDWDGFQWTGNDPGVGSIFAAFLRAEAQGNPSTYSRNLMEYYTHQTGSHINNVSAAASSFIDNVFIDLGNDTGGSLVITANGHPSTRGVGQIAKPTAFTMWKP